METAACWRCSSVYRIGAAAATEPHPRVFISGDPYCLSGYQQNTAMRLFTFLPTVAANSLPRRVCLRISTL